MSNTETSKLYESVIEDVINDSRQDFENNGIDESTLQELRRIWCEKLTQSELQNSHGMKKKRKKNQLNK